MDEKISKLFLPLLDKLYNTEPAGEPFRKPVDPVKYGCFDYYLYVKHPIDLSTIRNKLVTNQYKDAWQFVADIQLMFSNAYLFNKKGTPVYEFTNKLSKIWNTELTPIMQRMNYCCGTLHKFGPQLLFCLGTTPDRYCQIPIGSKYKCYQDSYSFCIPCFNKIETDTVNIQALICETSRMSLPIEPVKKKDFIDCTNDHWQYENFIQCTECNRRMHQICELYPTDQEDIAKCVQHSQIEEERKSLCHVPPEFKEYAGTPDVVDAIPTVIEDSDTDKNETSASKIFEEVESDSSISSLSTAGVSNQQDVANAIKRESEINKQLGQIETSKIESEKSNHTDSLADLSKKTNVDSQTLDDELLHLARDVEDSHSVDWTPSSPNPIESKNRLDGAKDSCQNNSTIRNSNVANQDHRNPTTISKITSSLPYTNCSSTANTKNSVDNIAARLSINKLSSENHVDDLNHHHHHHNHHHSQQHQKTNQKVPLKRDKFVCNQCYKKRKLGGQNERYRKFSARRLPHSRMSRYIETKVNEYIRENSPTAGEMTIRVLTAYRDNVSVKPEMKEYMNRCRMKDPSLHPNLEEYPDEFGYTNRAIFAWQEIDGVDVCVFGMHVQEYGEDCPEPNKQVVYLSYLDSVHFFRPRQFRTAVYHEILLSYFKYVKKLGFRRVFIWVCPSRKGDDYIFYRHPTEQKMPTLKRLSDWYVHLLDKGVLSGIVERHQNIHDYAQTENWTSLFSMPYLSGDYWPGEFERLLKIMIESQKKYEDKMNLLKQQQQSSEQDDDIMLIDTINNTSKLRDISEPSQRSNLTMGSPIDRSLERYNVLSLSNLYQKSQPPISTNNGNMYTSNINIVGANPPLDGQPNYCTPEGDVNRPPSANDDIKSFGFFTPDSHRSEDQLTEQPLDLSKSSNASPESWHDEDQESEFSYRETNSFVRKRRKKSAGTIGYTKKRSRNSSQFSQTTKARLTQSTFCDGSSKHQGKATKACRKSSSQANRDSHGCETILNPEEELMKNLDRSLKRQREGFIVVRLSECDCSPHFESQRRREEFTFTCNLMKGREPFLTLARLENYEFSTLRRAKFSSLAMVKHLGQSFKLDPICNECYSFDSSKRHYICQHCEDFYLCTSCHENTHHDHIMSLMAPNIPPDIEEFLQPCSPPSGANSISSASSTISNKSFNESTSIEQSFDSSSRKDSSPSIPLHRHLSNTLTSPTSSMPLSCKKQRNHEQSLSTSRTEDEENAHINPFATDTNKLGLPKQPSPPPSHSSNRDRQLNVEFDQVMIESFVRHAEINYGVDFDEMRSESKKLLTHYWSCPIKDTCSRCKFVILSCSFMSVLMRSTRIQMMVNCNPNEPATASTTASTIQGNGSGTNNNSNGATHLSGINLTTTHRFGYQPKG